jgi:hypothetical protein
MQRVRIGITGLACVFLVVFLAAAIVGFRSDDSNATLNNSSNSGNMTAAEPKDPLAELGVAPGGSTGSESTPAPAPPRSTAR